MSAAGLYLDEDEDVFRCFRCSFAVPRSRWPEEENPWEVHRRMSPDCPLVNADAQHAEGRQLRSSEEGRECVDAARRPQHCAGRGGGGQRGGRSW